MCASASTRKGLAVVSAEMGLIGYDAPRSKQFFEQAIARQRDARRDGRGPHRTAAVRANCKPRQMFLPRSDTPAATKGLAARLTTRYLAGYFDAMGVPIVQGRAFNSADTPTSPGVVIINETMARHYWQCESRMPRHTADAQLAHGAAVRSRRHRRRSQGQHGRREADAVHPLRLLAAARHRRGDRRADARRRRRARRSHPSREMVALEPNVVILDHQTMDAQVAATLLPARFGAMSRQRSVRDRCCSAIAIGCMA